MANGESGWSSGSELGADSAVVVPVRSRLRRLVLFGGLAALVLALAACSSSGGNGAESDGSAVADNADDVAADATAGDGTSSEADDGGGGAVAVVLNQGGSLEGHTPRGFAGSGTGLFAGDELNANFPPDDGVQIWLTFELPPAVDDVTGATLRSDVLTVRGNPFDSLGLLEVAPVRYAEFGPQVVGLEPVGNVIVCPQPVGASFSCEIGEAVQAELAAGRSLAQFRLRFERTSDPDGEQDLAMFFLTDSNTNEPGIFELELRR